jgi:hypothetical protein
MKPILILTLLAAIAIFLLLESETVQDAVTQEVGDLSSPDTSGVPDPQGTSSDPQKVKYLAIAIAKAEGFFNPVAIGVFIQNRPQRNHNPGDITDQSNTATGKDSGGLNVYQNDNDGWNDLFLKIDRVLSGQSHTFPSGATFENFATTYTGGDNPTSWLHTVITQLDSFGYNLTSANTLEDYANA